MRKLVTYILGGGKNIDMKYLINGIVEIIKWGMILFAIIYFVETGLLEHVINLFK